MFEGACLDGGALRSVMGYRQPVAYCRMFNRPVRLYPSNMTFLFGDGSCDNTGIITIRLPLPLGSFLPLSVDVVHADIPLLVGLDILDRECRVPDNVDNFEISRRDNCRILITRKHGHMFIVWDAAAVRFSKAELQKLHIHFFHPNVQKLYNLLKRARPDDVGADTKTALEEIAASCHNCQSHRSNPYRFPVSILEEEIKFNHEVAVDLMWLKGNPILHIVDTQTRFQNAILLKGESARDVWDAFIEAWASVYIGYPNRIRSDRGSVFTSKFWADVTSLHDIVVQLSGVESHNSTDVGERYHEPLRQNFDRIITELPSIDSEVALRLSVKAINDTAGPDGLVPSLLVFGSVPSFSAMNMDIPIQRERMAALATAYREMASISAKLRVQEALRSKLPPSTRYLISPGDKVHVYRENKSSPRASGS